MMRLFALLLAACVALFPCEAVCQDILDVDADLLTDSMATEFSLRLAGQRPKTEAVLTLQCEKHKFKETRQVSPADFVTRNGLHEMRVRLMAPLGVYRIDFPDAKEPFFINTERLCEKLTGPPALPAAADTNTPHAATRGPADKMTLSVHLSSVNGASHLLLVVFDKNGLIADQYYGEMPRNRFWRSKPLPISQYRHRIVGIDGKGNGKAIKADVFADAIPR